MNISLVLSRYEHQVVKYVTPPSEPRFRLLGINNETTCTVSYITIIEDLPASVTWDNVCLVDSLCRTKRINSLNVLESVQPPIVNLVTVEFTVQLLDSLQLK